MNQIVTTEEYWDCDCNENYIHPKSEDKCNVCNRHSEEQPNSRVNEVITHGLPLGTDNENDVVCPFCGEGNFDLIGLKHHFAYYCKKYSDTKTI